MSSAALDTDNANYVTANFKQKKTKQIVLKSAQRSVRAGGGAPKLAANA